MRVFEVFQHCYIVQLDVQILVHALQCSSDGDVILELDRHFSIYQRLEKAFRRKFRARQVVSIGCSPEEEHLALDVPVGRS